MIFSCHAVAVSQSFDCARGSALSSNPSLMNTSPVVVWLCRAGLQVGRVAAPGSSRVTETRERGCARTLRPPLTQERSDLRRSGPRTPAGEQEGRSAAGFSEAPTRVRMGIFFRRLSGESRVVCCCFVRRFVTRRLFFYFESGVENKLYN